MKKIINGKKYDTDTAHKLLSYSNDYYQNDFHYYHETLYLKKTGEYFLFGEGNALSKYSQHCYGASTSGCEIIPLTKEDAMIWAEKHVSIEEYEIFFGKVEE